MTLHGKSLIAGQLGEAGSATFRAHDPATGTPLEPVFHEAHAAEAARAVDAAADAFSDYGRLPPEARARFLDTIASEIEALGDALIERTTRETGLPDARIVGERGRTCAQLRLFAATVREGSWVDARIDTALPERTPAPRPDIRRMLKPIGPVVVFGASNFPLAFSTAGGDTASAFAAGCPVVVKAHRAHPGAGELVAGAIARAAASCGLPPGVFSFVHGGAEIGAALVRHPRTAAVGFTGSHAAGRALFDIASSRPEPIPVFAEMSSVNPVLVLPGALRERGAAIAQGLFGSFTLGVGQFCTKPGLVFVLRGADADAFVEELARIVREAAGGTMLTAGILESFERARGAAIGVEGVRVIAASKAPAESGSAAPSIAWTEAANFLARPSLANEVFGPFALVIGCSDTEEMLRCLTSLGGQLTATLHANDADLATARALIDAAERRAGRVILNGFPTGVEVCAAMHHGGPYPATTDVRFTSVGTAAILRFARPVCYQNFPDDLLPAELKDANPYRILRTVNGELTRDAVTR
ncbi:MAG TPA: aldehyde dehydrogenase (NADP(+)) [Gammaproteobacteria bacterium]